MNTPESILKERHKCVLARSLYYTLKILSESSERAMYLRVIESQLPNYMDFDEWELAPDSNSNIPRWQNIYESRVRDLIESGCAHTNNNDEWRITNDGSALFQRFDGKPFDMYNIIVDRLN